MSLKKIMNVLAAFFIMLCLGGVYAWSIVAPELMKNYGFSASKSQSIMGILIGILPLAMIFAGKVEKRIGTKAIGFISAGLFVLGYLISGFSKGNFYLIFLGNGIMAGISTGFGYLAALTSPVKCFPEKKGLMTGIAVSGFGLAATALSFLVENLLRSGKDILEIIRVIGLSYGSVIFISSLFLINSKTMESEKELRFFQFVKSPELYRLILGFFFGTFAGLLVVGSLKPIGAEQGIDNRVIIAAVSVFAIANFFGRIAWGFLSDFTGASLAIFSALALQGASIFLLGKLPLSSILFVILSIIIGFSFGGNFVLFAKRTAEVFGVENLGAIYPYVSFGYALGGIFGPFTGGFLYDKFNNFFYATIVASLISILGGLIFLLDIIKRKTC